MDAGLEPTQNPHSSVVTPTPTPAKQAPRQDGAGKPSPTTKEAEEARILAEASNAANMTITGTTQSAEDPTRAPEPSVLHHATRAQDRGHNHRTAASNFQQDDDKPPGWDKKEQWRRMLMAIGGGMASSKGNFLQQLSTGLTAGERARQAYHDELTGAANKERDEAQEDYKITQKDRELDRMDRKAEMDIRMKELEYREAQIRNSYGEGSPEYVREMTRLKMEAQRLRTANARRSYQRGGSGKTPKYSGNFGNYQTFMRSMDAQLREAYPGMTAAQRKAYIDQRWKEDVAASNLQKGTNELSLDPQDRPIDLSGYDPSKS